MAVAALRRYQTVSPLAAHSGPDACRNIIGILFNGMVRHAAAASPEDFDAFADRINSLAEGIEGKPAQSGEHAENSEGDLYQMVLTACSGVEAFEAYTIHAAQNAADRESELRELILTAAEGLFVLSGNREAGPSERLAGLRNELRSATDVLSLRRLKARLAESVQRVARGAPGNDRDQARQEVKPVPALEHSLPANEAESLGVSQRKAAEDAIRNSLAHPGRKFVVTVVMDSVQAINHKYGNEIGDRVIKELGTLMQRHLTSADRLYRWTGPAYTALIHRDESIDYMRSMVRRIFDPPSPKDFDIDGRKITLPLSAAWSVVALIPPATNIFSYIDRFVASALLPVARAE